MEVFLDPLTNNPLILRGSRMEVARGASELMGDELLADVLLRTAQEDQVAVVSPNHSVPPTLRSVLSSVQAVYSHPISDAQRVAVWRLGAWTPTSTHPGVWRR